MKGFTIFLRQCTFLQLLSTFFLFEMLVSKGRLYTGVKAKVTSLPNGFMEMFIFSSDKDQTKILIHFHQV